jgi:predicted pyridoxine 5'-phosphate oxidase superfamily flavin-nucleotide-binding protein
MMTLQPSSDVAFSARVKQIQEERGSRAAYARMESRGGFRTEVDADLASFLSQVNTAYLATATAAGQPYAQHRGGPKGFIHMLDDHTLAFADYTGNRQFITTGNLAENNRAFLFLMDYADRQRIKIWGTARVDDDPTLVARLMPEGYAARAAHAIVFDVDAWDSNCPQHIPQMIEADEVQAALARLEAENDGLNAENAALRAQLLQGR